MPCCSTRLCDLFQQFHGARMQLAAFLVHEERHRHAPLALTRQGPVRAVGDHAVQPRLAPGREEGGLFNCFQSGLAQAAAAVFRRYVHAGKPLRSGAIDDWRLVAPAMHVAVIEHHQLEQGADFFQLGADWLRCFPDRHAAEERQPRRVGAVAQHRLQDFVVGHAVRLARDEVVQTIGRRRVDDAGAGIQRHIFADKDRRGAVVTWIDIGKWMLEAQHR